jgi:hypothetical protein
MTTYGTYDIDTVPAPSDFELATIAAELSQLGRIRELTFNGFCHHACVGRHRDAFHAYVEVKIDGYRGGLTLRDSDWWKWWNQFQADDDWWLFWHALCQYQDARDLADTQADALS